MSSRPRRESRAPTRYTETDFPDDFTQDPLEDQDEYNMELETEEYDDMEHSGDSFVVDSDYESSYAGTEGDEEAYETEGSISETPSESDFSLSGSESPDPDEDEFYA